VSEPSDKTKTQNQKSSAKKTPV